ncbi:MAG: histidine--tRNA ligase [Candidatus Stahlbacteria bacterium]|nr:histidine--tRNA ligase [Candidatus Stahlbacteria bacterium]
MLKRSENPASAGVKRSENPDLPGEELKKKLNKPQPVRGMHDRLPEEMRRLEKVILIIKNVFKKYGFEQIETPALEYWEFLSGKDRYGEEEKLIYRFKDRGGREVGLRYDFTVPLARVMATYTDITLPFKRFQIQQVWRGDSPQYGRFREFYQCDADIVGSNSMIAEAECISINYEIFSLLGFKEFKIRINNRKILQSLCNYCQIEPDIQLQVFRAMDKVERIGIDGVAEKLELHNVPVEKRKKLIDILQDCKQISDLKKVLKNEPGVTEIIEIFRLLSYLNVPQKDYCFDIWMARGLDYYTGPIFETAVKKPKIGSLASGGRFDKLVEAFKPGHIMPATGISIGLERVLVAMKELDLCPTPDTYVKVLVAIFDPSHIEQTMQIAYKIRNCGIQTEVYAQPDKINTQFKYADKRKIPFVIIVGPDEVKNKCFTIKNMATGKQQAKKMSDLIIWAKSILDK